MTVQTNKDGLFHNNLAMFKGKCYCLVQTTCIGKPHW